jgi:hypothetical protein
MEGTCKINENESANYRTHTLAQTLEELNIKS